MLRHLIHPIAFNNKLIFIHWQARRKLWEALPKIHHPLFGMRRLIDGIFSIRDLPSFIKKGELQRDNRIPLQLPFLPTRPAAFPFFAFRALCRQSEFMLSRFPAPLRETLPGGRYAYPARTTKSARRTADRYARQFAALPRPPRLSPASGNCPQ